MSVLDQNIRRLVETPPGKYAIPKDPRDNALWRRGLMQVAAQDSDMAAALKQRLDEDILLWVNLTCWLYEPRLVQMPRLPFITWPQQDKAILSVRDHLMEGQDLLGEKSRDQGLTWICLHTFYHLFRTVPNLSFLLLSHKEEKVWKPGDPDAHFTKLDFMYAQQPPWLRPKLKQGKLHWQNTENESVIDGESTTGLSGLGGRRTGIFWDEAPAADQAEPGKGEAVMSATRANTNCRIITGTPGRTGQRSAFYKMRTREQVDILTMGWWTHPIQGEGLYTCRNGRLEVLDDAFIFPSGYEFKLDVEGKLRSPWYDGEEKRAGSSREMAYDVDIDYVAAGGLFFEIPVLQRLEEKDVRPPTRQGNVDFQMTSEGKVERPKIVEGGPHPPLKLWCELDSEGRPPLDRNYVIGIDVSAGQGKHARAGSNSIASIGDTTTKEKVGEFASPEFMPEEFARIAYALGVIFGGPTGAAYLIWESNGPGLIFGRTLVERLGYPNFYLRTRETSIRQEESNIPGWHTNTASKLLLLGAYRSSLGRNEVTIRSADSFDEAKRYIEDEQGRLVPGTQADLGTGAQQQHGDRVIGDALMDWGLRTQPKVPQEPTQAPRWSMKWRDLQEASVEIGAVQHETEW